MEKFESAGTTFAHKPANGSQYQRNCRKTSLEPGNIPQNLVNHSQKQNPKPNAGIKACNRHCDEHVKPNPKKMELELDLEWLIVEGRD